MLLRIVFFLVLRLVGDASLAAPRCSSCASLNFLRSLLFAICCALSIQGVALASGSAEELDEKLPAHPPKTYLQCAEFADKSADSATSASLEFAYRRVWQLVRDNTMFPERLGNWIQWQRKYDGKLQSERDLERAVNQMLRVLDDQYTYFRGVSETRSRSVGDDERNIVSYQMLDKSYGYLSVKTFSSRHVAEELQMALRELSCAKSYILDLRDNKGGYVDQALLCFSLLVDQGKFVSIHGRQSGSEYHEEISVQPTEVVRMVNRVESRESRLMNLTGSRPLIVLVNDGTRSASEMLAGALRDVRQARLIGSKTFGKGVVQGTWQLDPGCSIKIAMARFFLPGGASINGRGIHPDVVAEFDADGRESDFVDALISRHHQHH